MYLTVFQALCFFFYSEQVLCMSEGLANNPVFNLDHTALEKNIAAIFNKVAHSSATTKRSVPAYEAQVSQSSTQFTSPAPSVTSLTTSPMLYASLPKVTNPPLYRELPSYAPPSRTLFTPPLPPEYANPFADKPTLRGTNTESHSNIRRPMPPPSYTPAHERIPIKPPDLVENTTKNTGKYITEKEKVFGSVRHSPLQLPDREKNLNDTVDFVPSLHITSISRILSGSHGRKQDIPEILLKPIPTKSSTNPTATEAVKEILTSKSMTISPNLLMKTSTLPSVITSSDKENDTVAKSHFKNYRTNNAPLETQSVQLMNNRESNNFHPQPSMSPSKEPEVIKNKNIHTHWDMQSLETTWKIAWSFHVYLSATMFTLIALYSVYKIVRFNEATNLLSQSYFLAIHLLLTFVCTLRCFHLFYDAYNVGNSLPQTLSKVIMFLPTSFLAAAFATLILYMARSSSSPCLYHNKFFSPIILVLTFIVHTTLCIFLQISSYLFDYADESKIFPLVCQCIYILLCVSLGLCYMYVYRVIRSQLNASSPKSMNNQITADYISNTLNIAITTSIATALLFILMGFVQLYGVFGVRERLHPHPWLWWGWEFSVRLIELSLCGLIAWVSSLTQCQLREKQIQQHVMHSGFALFPCGSSSSTENIDDALYPTICNANHAIQNYTIRTGKHVYDDSFPLNTLQDHSNIDTCEKHSTKKCITVNHMSLAKQSTFGQRKDNPQIHYKTEQRHKINPVMQTAIEQSSTSGSTMLVAEDGFVRFRNLGSEDDLSDHQSIINASVERRNSLSFNSRGSSKRPPVTAQTTYNYHQSSLPRLHLNLQRNHALVYDT